MEADVLDVSTDRLVALALLTEQRLEREVAENRIDYIEPFGPGMAPRGKPRSLPMDLKRYGT